MRELPVLRALVDIFENSDYASNLGVRLGQLAPQAGMADADVAKALRALSTAEPPYIKGTWVSGVSHPIIINRVTERALRAVGQWPASGEAADAIVAALDAAAESEPDEEKRSALRRTAGFLGGAGREVFYRVLTGVATGQVDHHLPH